MQMVMTSEETQIQTLAHWPMSHAKRVTNDNWWFSRHASKLNYHASEKYNHLPFNKLGQEIEIS